MKFGRHSEGGFDLLLEIQIQGGQCRPETERAGDQVDPLSGGMKRRLTIARSLINDPEILILDEPTTGLDPQARHVVWDRLFSLKQRGVTLILTTHYMDEAEQLCDRLVVMDHATIVAEGAPRELIERYSTPEVLELRFDPELHEQAAEKIRDLSSERTEVLADRILLYVTDGDAALSRVFILYPDPWPKRRHNKRRVISRETVAELARVARPGATVRFATDIDDYAGWTLARFLASPYFRWPAESATISALPDSKRILALPSRSANNCWHTVASTGAAAGLTEISGLNWKPCGKSLPRPARI